MNFTTKKVSIPVESQVMDGTLYTPDINKDKLPAVVVYHGRGSSQTRYTDRAEELAKAGFLTLIFSFRGCGDSDGEFKYQTLEMGYQDSLAGYDFSDNNSIEAIARYTGSLFLIQHELDNICPKKQTDAFFNYATLTSKKEKVMMNGVGHPLIKKEDRDKSNKITVKWFKETL